MVMGSPWWRRDGKERGQRAVLMTYMAPNNIIDQDQIDRGIQPFKTNITINLIQQKQLKPYLSELKQSLINDSTQILSFTPKSISSPLTLQPILLLKIIKVIPMNELHKRQLSSGEAVYFSLVEKESQRGFSFNKRVLLMLQNHLICYLSSPKLDFPLTPQFIAKNAKMVVPLKQITKLSYKPQHNAIHIAFCLHDQTKKTQKNWVLKMATAALLNSWQQIFDQYTNRSRKGTLENANLKEPLNSLPNDALNKMTYYNNRQIPLKPNANALQQELANSAQILKQDLTESYFANVHLNTPSSNRQSQPIASPNTGQPKHLELSKNKDRSSYFSRFGGQNQSQYYNFKNYYRPYLDDLLNIQNAFLRASQLNQFDNKYAQFIQYAKHHVTDIIQTKLGRIIEAERQRLQYQNINQPPTFFKYIQIQDLTVEFGFIQLKQVANNAFICDDSLSKRALKNYKNLQYLYRSVSKDPVLKSSFFIPMSCLVIYKGLTCIVSSKIDPSIDEQNKIYIENNEGLLSGMLFERLSLISRISFDIFQDQKNIKFVPRNRKQDKFAIVSAYNFLPQLQENIPIRREAFASLYGQLNENFTRQGYRQSAQQQKVKIADFISTKTKQLSDLMNKLQVYPISPTQLPIILHTYGLNMKLLGKLHNLTSQPYLQGILKTEAALRAFKKIFQRKLQQNAGRPQAPPLQPSAKNILNLLLGSDQNTTQIWKVVSLHCQKSYGISVEPSQINKGYFFLGLTTHLAIQIFPASSSVDNIFKMPAFIQGVRFQINVKCPIILPTFLRDIEEDYDIPMQLGLFKKVMQAFQLQERPFPLYIQVRPHLHSKLLHLCAFYIRPKDPKTSHLQLYGLLPHNQFINIKALSLFTLQRKMTEIRWEIKQEAPRQHILLLMTKLKQNIQNYYGTYHPFLSDISELHSLYHLELGEQEEAIAVCRDSLSNMIQCCGNNSRHIKISNNYYQIGQRLLKCYRLEEALLNYKKAKQILQVNNYQQLPQYAHILYKIGTLHLAQHKDETSYELFLSAINIYEKHDPLANWDALVQLYDLLPRCQLRHTSTTSKFPLLPNDLKFAQHCLQQLERVLAVELEFELCSDQQFVSVMKIIIQQYFNRIKTEDVAIFRDYLIQLCDFLTVQHGSNSNIKESILFFKEMIMDGQFPTTLQNYVINTGEIQSRLKNDKKVGRLMPHMQNDVIESYDLFMRRLVGLLGESFLLNILK